MINNLFKNKYMAVSAMNKVTDLANKLDVKYRCNPEIGITILNGPPKLFKLNKSELKKAQKLIKERANAELQTKLM